MFALVPLSVDEPTTCVFLQRPLDWRANIIRLTLFGRSQLLKIGRWDEQFIGWGSEEQDIIERYRQSGYYLCICPELCYLHLSHPPNEIWTETALVEQNKQH